MQFLYVFQVNGYLSAFWADSDFRLLHSASPPFVFIVCQHQAIGCSFDFNATIINHFRITSNASTHSNLQFELKYATVVLLHRIEADTHSCDNAYNQLYRTDDNESANLRLLKDQEKNAKDYHSKTDNQCSKSNELAKRLSVFFGHSLPMIPMQRGYIASHIDDSKYGN